MVSGGLRTWIIYGHYRAGPSAYRGVHDGNGWNHYYCGDRCIANRKANIVSEQTTDAFQRGQRDMMHRASASVVQSGLSFDRELLATIAEKILGLDVVDDPLKDLVCRIDRIERLIALLYTLPLETGWTYHPAIRAITKEVALEKNPTAESGRSGHR